MRKLRVRQYSRYVTAGKKNTKGMVKRAYKGSVNMYKQFTGHATPTIPAIREVLANQGKLDKEFFWITKDFTIHSNSPAWWIDAKRRYQEGK